MIFTEVLTDTKLTLTSNFIHSIRKTYSHKKKEKKKKQHRIHTKQ